MRRLILAVPLLSLVVTMAVPPAAEAKTKRVRAVCGDAGCEAGVATDDGGRTGGRSRGSRKRKAPGPVTCRYHRLDVPEGVVLTRPDGSPIPADGPGRWYEKVCVDSRETAEIEAAFPDPSAPTESTQALQQIVGSIDRTPVFVRTGAPPLVEEAFSRLTFPDAQPHFSPSSPWTFANHPTSLWLDGGLAPTATTAEVPGLRVTVTATPERVDWDTADGTPLSCAAPGRPPDPAVPGDRGDCVHTWTWPSGQRPEGAYPVTATVHWRVTWTVDGAPGGGDLGTVSRRSAPVMVPVAEIQAVNTPPEEPR